MAERFQRRREGWWSEDNLNVQKALLSMIMDRSSVALEAETIIDDGQPNLYIPYALRLHSLQEEIGSLVSSGEIEMGYDMPPDVDNGDPAQLLPKNTDPNDDNIALKLPATEFAQAA